MNNGSYSFSLGGGTVLNVTVYVAPCGKCAQASSQAATQQQQIEEKAQCTNHDNTSLGSATCTSTAGDCAQTVQPFHHEPTRPTTFEKVYFIKSLWYRMLCTVELQVKGLGLPQWHVYT